MTMHTYQLSKTETSQWRANALSTSGKPIRDVIRDYARHAAMKNRNTKDVEIVAVDGEYIETLRGGA